MKKFWISACGFLIYSVLFFPMQALLGPIGAAFASLPVLLTAWHFGLWGGIIAGVFALLLNMALMAIWGGDVIQTMIIQGGPGALITVFFGGVVGWLRDVRNQLQETEQALRAAKRQAENANYLKSTLLATMSHELRTPLNAIIGFVGVMTNGMAGEMDSDAREMLQRIDANSQRLLTLVNQVLDVAKIEAGEMQLLEVQFQPRTLAAAWANQMRVLADQKQLQFSVAVSDTVPTALIGDPERLSQIAINLLSNAFKFTPAGSVQAELDYDDCHLSIQVTDTGIGIPADALQYIFDEFRQVDASFTRSYQGSGLGLAISRSLCNAMDGNISVTSKIGQGSRFVVKIPLKLPQSTPLMATEEPRHVG